MRFWDEKVHSKSKFTVTKDVLGADGKLDWLIDNEKS